MKKAFTLIELVFVVIVIGILAAVIIPKTNEDRVSEFAIDLTSKIRYTQHLAMIDDKFDANNATWFRERWQIEFVGTDKYSIQSNGVFAKDPSDKTDLEDVELLGMTVTLSGGCANEVFISFDQLGRPIIGDISDDTTAYESGQLLTDTCVITLTNGTTSRVINVEPETGYTHII